MTRNTFKAKGGLPDKARGEVVLDPQLAAFYQVTTVAGLVAAQEEHIQKLQDTVRRNVKPWEDAFPPTLLPKYMRDSGLLDGEEKAALAAELQRIDNISAAIGGTPEIARMYEVACIEFVRHPALLAMLAPQARPDVTAAINAVETLRARAHEASSGFVKPTNNEAVEIILKALGD